ncbi:multicopper oxidase domain-containing protein [Terrilactibacillus sp. BCM23-1]|uniref:Multicopper oxidase domain-containing protein n=1 Tax=Terrilactibacillus tamarindi TaxID=2599694 RepID=A0A6N8CSB6_9BACI|nr:multicopper oxidase family protein [Terrilactibacillus tamarindi]MTT32580.1 multicopper oxidase domain-containing protein [Terrilactibacillus tamarindi]
MKKMLLFTIVVCSLFIITACSTSNKDPNKQGAVDKREASEPLKVLKGPTITLVAKEVKQKLRNGVTVPVWTFNGSAPGPEIRVKKGEKIRVTLKNDLPSPVSIHWHGYPVPNNMDGVPNVTQDAVAPGKSFTYEFTASKVGTYWYHSHEDSVNQVDRGLYGALVVEDPKDNYDKDYTLMLDEWVTNKKYINNQIKTMTGKRTSKEGDQDSGMNGMDMGNMDMGQDSEMNMANDSHSSHHNNSDESSHSSHHNNSDESSHSSHHNNKTSDGSTMMGSMKMMDHMGMYDLYTINGKSGHLIKPLNVKEGDRVRLRFINAGYLSHNIHIHGHNIKVIATDGQPINNPSLIKNQVMTIAPGERYDIVFTADNPGKWLIEDHGKSKGTSGMKAVISYQGIKKMNDKANASQSLPSINLTQYGTKSNDKFTLDQKYDLEYSMDLNVGMNGNKMIYTINGKTYPNTDPIKVKKGDLVKVKLVNRDMMNHHPMHLHGHFFQILSKNGKPYSGSPIMKDTLNLKPGEEYEVAFVADNPGNWMFHCHDLHHASAGMDTEVKYTDYQTNYKPKSSNSNKTE